MRKLIPLLLLSVSLSFGSVIDYTINFYDSDGRPVNDPSSVNGFSYDASAPVGSQFTGFEFRWDASYIFFDYGTGNNSPQIENFGEALISNSCTSPTWGAYAQFYTGSDDFHLECDYNTYIGSTFTLSILASDDSGGGIFTVCQVGMTCAAPAITPEPSTALITGLGLLLLVARRRRKVICEHS